MRQHDLYGLDHNDLEQARRDLEAVLGLSFEVRESSYHGDYYGTWAPGKESFMLKRNIDLLDGEALEAEHPEMPLLLYVEYTDRADELQALFSAELPNLKHLWRVSAK